MDPVSNLELSNFAIMPSNCFFLYNVAILRQRACFRQRLSLAALAAVSQAAHSASTSVQIIKWLYWRYPYWQVGRTLQGMFAHALS